MTETTLPPTPEAVAVSIPPEVELSQPLPTVGRSIAWLFVFALLFYGAAVVYGMMYGGYFPVCQPHSIQPVYELT